MGQVVVAGAKGKTNLEKMHNHYIRTAAMTNASELLIRNLRTSHVQTVCLVFSIYYFLYAT